MTNLGHGIYSLLATGFVNYKAATRSIFEASLPKVLSTCSIMQAALCNHLLRSVSLIANTVPLKTGKKAQLILFYIASFVLAREIGHKYFKYPLGIAIRINGGESY